MNTIIRALAKKDWKDHKIIFRYETSHYFHAEIVQELDKFSACFVKKAFAIPVKREFTGTLFPDYYVDCQAFGIFKENSLIACLEIYKEDWSNRLRITELWVDEEYRRQGLGGQLMAFAKQKAMEFGCRALILETQSCNEAAISFYFAHGLSFFGFDLSCYGNHDVENNEVRLELGMYLK